MGEREREDEVVRRSFLAFPLWREIISCIFFEGVACRRAHGSHHGVSEEHTQKLIDASSRMRMRGIGGAEAASGTSLPEVSIIPSSFYNYKPRPSGNAKSRNAIMPRWTAARA